MRAMQLRAPASLDNLVAVDLPDLGAPRPGEIRVRLRASSLNYHDYAVVAGMLPTADDRIPLSDGAGEVVAVGEGVSDFVAGDSVVSLFFPRWQSGERPDPDFRSVPGDGMDGYAREEVVAPARWFTPAPNGYSHAEAATLPCAGVTAWRALVVDGRLKPGETVLVQGTGGVSIFALQFAKAVGAKVIATSSSDAKLNRLQAIGADYLINYRQQEEWGKAALAATDGRGVDHIVEIGGAGTLEQSMIAARPGGHIALIGVLAGRRAPITTALLMAKELRVFGLTVGSRKHQLDMIKAIEVTAIRPVIDRSFPLAELVDAFRYQTSGGHFGKILIKN